MRSVDYPKAIKAAREFAGMTQAALAEARQKRDEIRGRVSSGESAFVAKPEGDTFAAVVGEWLEKKVLPIRTPGHVRSIRYRVGRWILPSLGPVAILVSPTQSPR